MPRMRILSSSEQSVFDRPPVLNHKERKQFFDLPTALIDKAAELRTPVSQIGFVLMCGYFRAAKRFYGPQDFHQADINVAAKLLDLRGADFKPEAYTKQTHVRHHKLILDFYGFTPFGPRGLEAAYSGL